MVGGLDGTRPSSTTNRTATQPQRSGSSPNRWLPPFQPSPGVVMTSRSDRLAERFSDPPPAGPTVDCAVTAAAPVAERWEDLHQRFTRQRSKSGSSQERGVALRPCDPGVYGSSLAMTARGSYQASALRGRGRRGPVAVSMDCGTTPLTPTPAVHNPAVHQPLNILRPVAYIWVWVQRVRASLATSG
jgi:hypothetical protein